MSGAWLNINSEGTFQEFHTHNNAIFSCVYWVAAPVGSGKLIFEDLKNLICYKLEILNQEIV